MTPNEAKADCEAQIRGLLDDWVTAIRAKDVEHVVSHYAPDVVSFDLAPPLDYRGTEEIRRSLEEWFPTFRGPVGYEIHDLSVTVGDEVAFSRSLNHITGKRTNDEETDVWVRATVCYQRSGGKWLIAHEHISVPFYMEGSYKAALDLKPSR
ncbi:MAG TPA: SgcJ/EcaC family oxidoreductase [Methyloceanibacter sp.]|nr:SgcJ/EcaC family oxidoreductase [Methyloceanibacter sp.]